MKLQGVSFANWLRSHSHKDVSEKWLRELYPWPVLAQVEYDPKLVEIPQAIGYDGAQFDVTLKSIKYQPNHRTNRYRLLVESNGLGWHSRSYADEFDVCGTPDGLFVTLFHARREEPLEKIARAFFSKRWTDIDASLFKTLAVSRFLASSIAVQVAIEVFHNDSLVHYPLARLTGGTAPILANASELWIGFRFFSEDAYSWARRSAGAAKRIVALYFADTTYQIRTDLPVGVTVESVSKLDSVELSGKYRALIDILLRRQELPTESLSLHDLDPIIKGHAKAPETTISEADVHESLAALKQPCAEKSELRYQLAAAVVLNAWVESERRLGYPQRKKFYAFKSAVNKLTTWAFDAKLRGVDLWAEAVPDNKDPILHVCIDEVDFSFHAIPLARHIVGLGVNQHEWSGIRLKPIAPLVLAWARANRTPK
jgi:hypothetical protein